MPINNLEYAQEIYKAFVDEGVSDQVALNLTTLVIGEGGWGNYKTGDKKTFSNAKDLAKHVVNHHRRMFPGTLTAPDWKTFYRELNVTPKYKYNSERSDYQQWIESIRPGVKKRVNTYRKSLGQSPLAYQEFNTDISFARKGLKLIPRTKLLGLR